MRTIQLTLAYEGTRYAGWQVQPDRSSVQAVVERAILELTGETVKVAASGRTDAGVHALAQIVTFNSQLSIPIEGYRWGLITKLPDDVVVTDAIERPCGFHARFDTIRKTYRYVIHQSRIPSPWLKNYVWWLRSPLDVDAMQQAADDLVGTHDFRCFETQWPNRSSSVRTIESARWSTCPKWAPWSNATLRTTTEPALNDMASAPEQEQFLCFDITANGFLYNMVRSIVGTLIPIGRGRWRPQELRRIVETGDRSHAGDTAPASGLYLAHVETELHEQRLAERREKLRRRDELRDLENGDSLDSRR